jgi:hypothetical protein
MRAISNVYIKDPKTGMHVLFKRGDELPEHYKGDNPKVTGIGGEPEVKSEPSGEAPDDLSTLTVKELRARAEDLDVDLTGAKTKEDIIAALEAAA